MSEIFADTSYWIARIVRTDELHDAAKRAKERLGKNTYIVTTDEVLTELLNTLSKLDTRQRAVQAVQMIGADKQVAIVHQTHEGFTKGLALYKSRADKEYSLTDCISMNVMQARGIRDVLTADDHFRQAGFVMLMAR